MIDETSSLEDALARLKLDRFDEAAWTILYDRLVPRARASSYRLLCGDSARTADVVQDALERLLKYCDFAPLGNSDDLTRYFFKIIRRAAFDSLKKSASQGELVKTNIVDTSALDESDVDATPEHRPGPEDVLAAEQELRRLDDRLCSRDKLLLVLIAEGYDRAEIAIRLGITVSHAAVLVHRLRSKLRKTIINDS